MKKTLIKMVTHSLIITLLLRQQIVCAVRDIRTIIEE